MGESPQARSVAKAQDRIESAREPSTVVVAVRRRASTREVPRLPASAEAVLARLPQGAR